MVSPLKTILMFNPFSFWVQVASLLNPISLPLIIGLKERFLKSGEYEIIKEIVAKEGEPFEESTDSDAYVGYRYMKKNSFVWEFKKII